MANNLINPAEGIWQPIETAPRDGTEVLAWCDFDSLRCAIVISYEPNDENPKWPWWDWDCRGIHESVPTHWMPLPAPPEGNAV